MGNCYINTTIEVPNVHIVNFKPDYAGDKSRTADHTMRATITAEGKRSWRVQGRSLTADQRDAIYNYLVSVAFGAVSFWIYTLGGAAATHSINCLIEIENDDTAADRQFKSASGWENQPHDITLNVQEQ